jgi:hypothetical protein
MQLNKFQSDSRKSYSEILKKIYQLDGSADNDELFMMSDKLYICKAHWKDDEEIKFLVSFQSKNEAE